MKILNFLQTSSLNIKMSSEFSPGQKTTTVEQEPSIQSKRKAIYEEYQQKRICKKDIRRELPVSSRDETEYYFENFLRKVYPYYFTYSTHCKARWVGKKLIDVFSDEFQAHSKEEYEKNIKLGNIKINNKEIDVDYVLKNNDLVTNKSHRHEIAVIAAPIKIIHSSDDFIVVDKPPSIPVHPCGRYRHNCLLFILAKEYNLTELYSVHRLDRLTSGLIIFAKTIKKSQEVNQQIRERKVQKEYVCRVEGEFPDGEISCSEPIEVISPKMGICIVSTSGKDCKTIFQKLSYNGKSSVVQCKPKTGRMHQIRVHLQYLGHPIINDPIYNSENVFGPLKGKFGDYGKSREQLLEDLLNTHNLKKWLLDDNIISTEAVKDGLMTDSKIAEAKANKITLNALQFYLKSEGFDELAKKYVKKPEKFIIDEACDLCHQKYMDPQPKDMILFLHALRYGGDGWSFHSELPSWALENWSETNV